MARSWLITPDRGVGRSPQALDELAHRCRDARWRKSPPTTAPHVRSKNATACSSRGRGLDVMASSTDLAGANPAGAGGLVPQRTSRSTMSGCRIASSWAIIPPIDSPTTVADRAPIARSTSRTSSASWAQRERRRSGAGVARAPVVDAHHVERALELLDEAGRPQEPGRGPAVHEHDDRAPAPPTRSGPCQNTCGPPDFTAGRSGASRARWSRSLRAHRRRLRVATRGDRHEGRTTLCWSRRKCLVLDAGPDRAGTGAGPQRVVRRSPSCRRSPVRVSLPPIESNGLMTWSRRPERTVRRASAQDLAGRVAGKLVDELHPSRHLVSSEIVANVGSHVVGGELRSRAPDDERGEHLAELVVGDADDGDLGDRRVVAEQLLDLAREHVLAAGHDHVVLAPVDEQQPVAEVAEVARRQQPSLLLLAATGRVPVEPHRAADEDTPDRAGGDGVAVVVEDLDPHAEGDPARRRRCLAQVGGCGDRRDGDLGRPVQVVEHRAEPVERLGRQLAAECRAARRDHSQFGRGRRHEHVGSSARMRDSITGTTTSTWAWWSEVARSVASASKRRDSTLVVHRPRPRSRFVSPQPWKSGAAITWASPSRNGMRSSTAATPSIARRVAASRRTLRLTGGARGEDHHSPLLATRRGQAAVPASVGHRRLVERLGAGARDDVGELVVVDDRPDPLRPDHVRQLRPGEAGVEQDDVGARRRGRDEPFDEATVVPAQQTDP